MGIIRFAIDNPVKIAVGIILLVLFGLLSIVRVPFQLTPDVDKPIITVKTFWTGASPQEIESEIVDRQEAKLKSVTNLKKMTSSAKEGQAEIKLEFPVSVDRDIAYRDVSDKLRQVTGYPQEVDEPVIAATDDSMANTIAWIMLYSKDGQDVSRIKTFIEEKVKPQLERAEGIAEVPVFGGLGREIQIVVDAPLLAARSLSLRDIERALRRQNTNISAGTVEQGKRNISYRTVGEYRTVRDVGATVIAYQEGGPVLIRDVAKVVDGFKKQFGFVRSKGRPVIALPARKETGANVMAAMANLKERIKTVNKEILEPRGLGLELTQVYDETTYIRGAVSLVVQNIFIGGLLAVAVLMLFLRSGSATGIVAITIPICVIGTFLVIKSLNRSLNVVMLAGMAFAVGMVVDNAIVVLENIYRHRSIGKSRRDAALDGAREVWGAILASTLTTMAVFLPVIFIEEEAGQLFKDIAIAISSAVGLSLLVSVLAIPPLAAKYLSSTGGRQSPQNKHWRFAAWLAGMVAQLNRRVSTRIAVVAGASGAALVGSWLLMPAAEYLPVGNKNLVFGFIASPPGYSVEEFQRMALIVEEGDPDDPFDGLRPAWEADVHDPETLARLAPVEIRLGKKGDVVRSVPSPGILNFFFVSFDGGAFMGATSQEATYVKPLEQVLNRAGGRIPGVFTFFTQTSLFRSGSSSGNAVDVEVRGDDLKAVVASAKILQRKIMEAGYRHPRASPDNYSLGRPEVQLIPDRARASDLGLDVKDVGFIVEAAVDGAFMGEFNDHGDKIDMVVKIADTEGASAEDIAQIPIYTPSGHVVPIASAVQLHRTTAPQQINHIEEMNSVTLAVKPKLGVALQETMRELEQEVIAPLRKDGAIPASVITGLAGTADKLTQTQRALIGDFRHLFDSGSLWRLVAPVSLLVLGLLALVAFASVGRSIISPSTVKTVAWVAVLVTAVATIALNPSLVLALAQSRAFLALLITYLLMAALFESFVYPFVIMLSVPLAAVGGFAALRIVHEVSFYDVSARIQQLDVLTMLGFVILIGIVVNNAILIVHQALTYMRNDRLAPAEAVAMSVKVRTRPIVMSALTSIFGMFPLVVMSGAGSELYRGLGSVVLGGLLVSTAFTLLVVPAMFTLFLDAQRWLAMTTKAVDTPEAVALPSHPDMAATPSSDVSTAR